ncbi:hypothetical protein KKG71_06115 [Patescibacteria group bacterium]|nr:hypothetical protein [Patescibacteria group bacterium]
MAGKIKQMIDEIVSQRSKGNTTIARLTKAKLILKGIDPDNYDDNAEDDDDIIGKLRAIADENNIQL